MDIGEYSFDLPPKLIATEPANPRDACNLMLLDRKNGQIRHSKFFSLPDYLNKGDVLVFNDSRVIPARINFIANGRVMEILLIRRINNTDWIAIGKPSKHLKENDSFRINQDVSFKIMRVDGSGERIIRFNTSLDNFSDVLSKIGKAPLPPYIKNSGASFDDYQTIYAKNDGSIAAPTAGLHFTNDLLSKLEKAGVQLEYVTLHVGLGTFLPVKTADLTKHIMHSELFSLDQQTAQRLSRAKMENRRIIAVGTTSVRVIESTFDGNSEFKSGYGETSIFIYPGYKWRAVDGIITNFHLPKSTLLLLVSSFAGKKSIFSAYNDAIVNHYRFYSFGDAMFIS